MKKIMLISIAFLFICGCATMKYEAPKLDPVAKTEYFKLPESPFTEPPVPIFLKKDNSGKWVECSKEEGILIAYIPREHDKIVLRLQYDKDIITLLVRRVNVQIDITNARAELERDQLLAKEVYKQMWIDSENRNVTSKTWNDLEKGGLSAIIIAQLIVILGLAL